MASTIAEAAEKAFEKFAGEVEQDSPAAAEDPDEIYLGPDEAEEVPDEPAEDDDDAPEGSSDAEGTASTDNRIEVTEEDLIVLPDGTEVPVKESALRQADYTRKTQQLAEERKKLEEAQAKADQLLDDFDNWYQERAANPDRWITEIAKSLPDRGVRTQMIARALRDMAAGGYLEDDFVELFGLTGGKAAEFAAEPEADRVAQLEAKLRQQEAERDAEIRVREQAAILQGQWAEIKAAYGLAYSTPQEELEAKREVLQFAKENGVPNLRVAFDAMSARRQTTATARQPDEATTEKKRATRAIAQRSAGAGQTAPPKKKAKTVRGAAELALEKYLAGA